MQYSAQLPLGIITKLTYDHQVVFTSTLISYDNNYNTHY